MDDAYSSNDIESFNPLLHNIDSVIGKISYLCKSKDMFSKFNEMSHIADVSIGRLGDRLSYLR